MVFQAQKMSRKNVTMPCLLTSLLLTAGGMGIVQASEQGSSPAGGIFGANYFDKDIGVTVGAKLWSNQWDLPLEMNHTGTNSTIHQFESGSEMSFIPAFLVRYKNFFVGGSYLTNTKYSFSAQSVGANTIKPFGERKEWDLNLGYFVMPNLAVSLGYKTLTRGLTYTNSDPSEPAVVDSPLSVKAPILGISVSAPINKGFNLYGNLAYGWLSGDYSYNDATTATRLLSLDLEGNYTFGELGLNYTIPLQGTISAVTISGGYRFQRLDMKAKGAAPWGSAGDQHDSTAGFVLGASASF